MAINNSQNVVIGQRVITIPGSGADPNWSPGVIDAIVSLAAQLQAISSTFDIAPSVQVLTSDTNTNLDIVSASFPSNLVRSFIFSYATYRTNGADAFAQEGTVSGVYNSLSATWTLQHEFTGPRQTDGTAYITFSMGGDQLTISTVAIGGSYDGTNSKLSYSAKTLLVSEN